MSELLVELNANETEFFCVNIPYADSLIKRAAGDELSITLTSFDTTLKMVLEFAESLIKATVMAQKDHFLERELTGVYQRAKKLIKVKDTRLRIKTNDDTHKSFTLFNVVFESKENQYDNRLEKSDAEEISKACIEFLSRLVEDYRIWADDYNVQKENGKPPSLLVDESLKDVTCKYDATNNSVLFANVENRDLLSNYQKVFGHVLDHERAAYQDQLVQKSKEKQVSLEIRQKTEDFKPGKRSDNLVGVIVPCNINSDAGREEAFRSFTALSVEDPPLIRYLPRTDELRPEVKESELLIRGVFDGIVASRAILYMELEAGVGRDTLKTFNKSTSEVGINSKMARNMEDALTISDVFRALRGNALFTFTYSEAIRKYELTRLELLNPNLPVIGSGQGVIDF